MAISKLTNIGKIPVKSFCRTNAYQKMTDFALNHVTSAEQRLMIGITGIVMQPWIDLHNKNADKETRVYSACKNCAKAFVGSATGFFIRKGCIKFVDSLLKKGKLLPRDVSGIQHFGRKVKNYGSTLGTGLAIIVMIATNFLLDAPLTQLLSTKLYNKATGKDNKQ